MFNLKRLLAVMLLSFFASSMAGCGGGGGGTSSSEITTTTVTTTVITTTVPPTSVTAPTGVQANAVSGDGIYLLPYQGCIAYSKDGTNWSIENVVMPTTSTFQTLSGFTNIAFGNGIWIALAPTAMYSYNPVNVYSVGTAGIGTTGVAISIDGINWTLNENPQGLTVNYITSFMFSNGMFTGDGETYPASGELR